MKREKRGLTTKNMKIVEMKLSCSVRVPQTAARVPATGKATEKVSPKRSRTVKMRYPGEIVTV